MKVKFSVYADRDTVFDLDTKEDVKRLGFTKEQWLALSDEEKWAEVDHWADQRTEKDFQEIE